MPVEVICGPMFSGKTEELIRRITRAEYANLKALSCKPAVDKRYGIANIRSHSGQQKDCISLKNIEEIGDYMKDRYDLIALEEAQFFEHLSFKNFLRNYNPSKVKILVSGLDMDFIGEPFENILFAMGVAVRVEKLTAVCMECTADATMTYKKSINTSRVELGADDKYEARCYDCWCRGYQLQRQQTQHQKKGNSTLDQPAEV